MAERNNQAIFSKINYKLDFFSCDCVPGFEKIGPFCIDVDECARGEDACDPLTTNCFNTHGSYQCSCQQGYSR